MASDAYASEAAAASQHRHPFLTQADVDRAKVTERHPNRRNGLAVVIRADSRLTCCGRLVSELTPGATYPNA